MSEWHWVILCLIPKLVVQEIWPKDNLFMKWAEQMTQLTESGTHLDSHPDLELHDTLGLELHCENTKHRLYPQSLS